LRLGIVSRKRRRLIGTSWRYARWKREREERVGYREKERGKESMGGMEAQRVLGSLKLQLMRW
jgi:hypothetical protein